MSDPVHWTIQAKVRDGMLDDLKALAAEMVADTQTNEPGALVYDWCLSDDGSWCEITERYADPSATLTHVQRFVANYAARFVAALEVKSYLVHGEPGEDVRTAIAGWRPRYMSQLAGFGR